MADIDAGLGLGIKEDRDVFIFRNQESLHNVPHNGISTGTNADATAKLSGKGDTGDEEIVLNNMSLYPISGNSPALELIITGTKYWPDVKLN